MAEMDLLRHVEVLSAVSGGAIVGALYSLFLKREFAASSRPTKSQYIQIVDAVQRQLVEGIRKDLRTRLFMNPGRVLTMIVSRRGLGQHMATLIHRHLLAPAFPTATGSGPIKLREASISADNRDEAVHNRQVYSAIVASKRGSPPTPDAPREGAFTKLVLNATCLNSGDRFWMSRDEIGDWRLGHFAVADAPRILRAKSFWSRNLEELEAECKAAAASSSFTSHELWITARLRGLSVDAPDPWNSEPIKGALLHLRDLEDYGYLRIARIAANAIQSERSTNPARETVLKQRFRNALLNIDDAVADVLAPEQGEAQWVAAYTLVDALYISCMARVASDTLESDLGEWTLAQAVAVSANFPPVLPPYQVDGLFHDSYVSRLGLTDGGVFENSGVQALLDEDCTCLIISDSGSPFRARPRASVGRLWMMRRIGDALMTGISWRQQSHVNALWNAGRIQSYAWIGIDTPRRQPKVGEQAPYESDLNGHNLARLRTDLDIFGDLEMAALINHGYNQADGYLRRYVVHDGPYQVVADLTAPKQPWPITVKADRLNRTLRVGRWRLWRSLRLFAPATLVPLLSVALVAVGLMSSTWLSDAAIWLGAKYPWIPWIATWFVAWRAPWWVTGISVMLLVAFMALEWLNVPGWLATKRGNVKWAARAAVSADYARALSGNVLWLAPPFLLPVWIALAVSVVAWFNYAVFSVPFAKATSMPPAGGPSTTQATSSG